MIIIAKIPQKETAIGGEEQSLELESGIWNLEMSTLPHFAKFEILIKN
jgi:hypothetical protein